MKRISAVTMVVFYLLAFGGPAALPRGARAQEAGGALSPAVRDVVGLTPSGGLLGPVPRSAGLPSLMAANGAFSAAVMTAIAGGQFDQVSLLADWDGREDLVADREGKVDDFSQKIPFGDPAFLITRTAISAHTIANGFNENVFYYGDSLGNVYVAQSPTLGTNVTPLPPGGLSGANLLTINLPTVLNAFGTLTSDSQIVVTGLCVNPVADLTSFSNVNGSYSAFTGKIGEILYVTFWDTGGGFRLAFPNNQIVRSGLLAFPVADVVSGAPAPPGTLAPAGFPVTVGGSFGVAFSIFSNLAGCAVDDDGSVYFQQVDLLGLTGANIVKVTDTGANQDRSAATNGFSTFTTLNPVAGNYGSASGPAINQVNRFTNFSGTSATFGNIVALAAGPANTLYAAVARSLVATDDAATQATEGPFANPAALGATPSMIISFADAGTVSPIGQIVVSEGFADVAGAGLTLTPGVNNFRAFVLGNGPDPRAAAGIASPVFGTTADTLKLEMPIDYSIYAGLTVDEERKVYVVSGGTPAGVGRNPSPGVGEILVFPDQAPADRRADYVDLRGDLPPNPPASGGNVGDGDSDRFDHIFWQAPLEQSTATPAGIAGLARGFLRYLNRTAPNSVAGLPNGLTQADSDSNGPISFEAFDPGHQVAGGDDQNPPFRGDDSDGAGSPVIAGPLNGGFEFTFGGNVPACVTPWNAFFLNSNGNITFGGGDLSGSPTALDFNASLPRIAPAWANLNPRTRSNILVPTGGGMLPSSGANTFPVQALGFAGINHFKIRWINVPENGQDATGSRNTFSISLFDDGTGSDENANQPLNPANPIGNNAVAFDLQEGPTDLRWLRNAGGVLAGRPARLDGTGPFAFEYGQMTLLGSPASPVITGYSTGNHALLGGTNLSEAGRTAVLGLGIEAAIFELFNTSNFDLRFEGNDTTLATPGGQPNLNRERLDFFGKSCSPPPTVPFVVTGAGPGGGPQVRVFDQFTGAERLSFFAFDPAFTGGVRVAVGDVDGDGVLDIIVGAGTGGAPHVRVFNSLTGAQLPGAVGSFFAFDPAFTGGVYVAAADLNGDGKADVIVGAGEGGGPQVRVFSGATGAQLPGPIGSFFAYSLAFTGGVRVAVGDPDLNGVRDVITGAGPGGAPHVRAFNSLTGAEIAGPLGSFFAFDLGFTGGVYVAGDSLGFVIAGAGAGGGPHVRAFYGGPLTPPLTLANFFAYSAGFTGGVRVAAGQYFGSVPAIVTGAGPGGGPHVQAFNTFASSNPPPQLDSFFAYSPAFTGGVFVAVSPP